MDNIWSDLHKSYSAQNWVDKPSLFAETAIKHFPPKGRLLDLGAGQGQDSRYFAEHNYIVASTDIEKSALDQNKSKLPTKLKKKVTVQLVDLRQKLPYDDASFDIVYAHLSLHYFYYRETVRMISEIHRVLNDGGVLAFLVNSVHDPEYKAGPLLEEDFFRIDKTNKRYFSLKTTRELTKHFNKILLDDKGETYKDRDKGVHNLVRYIGTKPKK